MAPNNSTYLIQFRFQSILSLSVSFIRAFGGGWAGADLQWSSGEKLVKPWRGCQSIAGPVHSFQIKNNQFIFAFEMDTFKDVFLMHRFSHENVPKLLFLTTKLSPKRPGKEFKSDFLNTAFCTRPSFGKHICPSVSYTCCRVLQQSCLNRLQVY